MRYALWVAGDSEGSKASEDGRFRRRATRRCVRLWRSIAHRLLFRVYRPMNCPFCGGDDTQVVDSRVSEEGDRIRRRRRCAACDKRFTTYETVELRLPQVVK